MITWKAGNFKSYSIGEKMKRKKFIQTSAVAGLGTTILPKLAFSDIVSNKRIKICCLADTLPSFTSKSEGVRENNATSEPEIKAEQIKSNKRTTIPNTWEKSITKNVLNKLEGSGSKFFDLV